MQASQSIGAYISIHAPHEGERPCGAWSCVRAGRYFNPRSPRGGATILRPPKADYMQFQSTLPTRGSDDQIRRRYKAAENFNPRSPRGGATMTQFIPSKPMPISIHAPHEGERPMLRLWQISGSTYFNPRSPRGGATLRAAISHRMDSAFQSTLPTRGSDRRSYRGQRDGADFNPRSPRGGATRDQGRRRGDRGISIHAPHEGERRAEAVGLCSHLSISIHAPHEGERPISSTQPATSR